MVDKKDPDKIDKVESTKGAQKIQDTKEVGEVAKVAGASSIASIGKAGEIGKRRATRIMTLEEREQIFKIVQEEAHKMFGNSGIPKEKQEMLEDAVKMAIDSGLLEADEEDSPDKKKKPNK